MKGNYRALLIALCLLAVVAVACGSPLPVVAADCSHGFQVPTTVGKPVDTSNMVRVSGETLYAISVAKSFGDTFEVYADPELTKVVDNRVPTCAVYLVSKRQTNSKGVEIAYVARILKIDGVLWGNWGLSGHMKMEDLSPIPDTQRATLTVR